jgi:hypothetical protein
VSVRSDDRDVVLAKAAKKALGGGDDSDDDGGGHRVERPDEDEKRLRGR